ncbi:MAG: hypothetical protein JNK23_11940 [Opitutaceae bacterium]|nr:hypothetical protein [Opitutaceae bacterium]
MKPLRLIACLLAVPAVPRAADDFFDRLAESLTFSAQEGRVRARVSGLLDLEAYDLQHPSAPGVIDTKDRRLFTPRLTTFLDAQLGPRTYAFAQLRVDRGFDPESSDLRVRFDEYALRLAPWGGRRVNFQLGKFATVVGNWVNRHGAWTDPFIVAPLPYDHLTPLWDTQAAPSSATLLRWGHVRPGLLATTEAVEKDRRFPIVWGPSYAIGAAASGQIGRFRYAAEAKLGSLSSRPDAWSHPAEQINHPTVNVRLGWRPSPMWDFGVSASDGVYLREYAGVSVPAGLSRASYRQRVIAHDMAFAWRHVQVWAEIYAARFEIPGIGDGDTIAGYAELRYKFTPQFSSAVRWGRQVYGTIPHLGERVRWGREVTRWEFAPAFRFTPHLQLKLHGGLQRGDSGARATSRTLASQLTVRF